MQQQKTVSHDIVTTRYYELFYQVNTTVWKNVSSQKIKAAKSLWL